MPAKNSRKDFRQDAYYHIYNRGVEKRIIYTDAQDYNVFRSYLSSYLLPKEEKKLQAILADSGIRWGEKDKALKLLRMNNFFDKIDLQAYCLMPNHFHFLVKQYDSMMIDRFMNSLCTRYTMFFNKKHKRVGPLFQGVYKAVLVETDEQLLHLSRYIHRNPISILQGEALQNYQWSSYGDFLRPGEKPWVRSEGILSFFSLTKANSYKDFVEYQHDDERSAYILNTMLLEDEA